MGKGRPRKKTNLNIEQITNELLDVVSNVYFSNLESLLIKETGKDRSYKAVEMTAEQFEISPMKMRKLLITSGAYATNNSTWIKMLKEEGKNIDQICMITGLKKASVNGMLPYSKAVYKLEERSVGAIDAEYIDKENIH